METVKTPKSNWANLATPEGITMIFCAIILDMASFLLAIFLLDDLGMLDIVGYIIIGTWAFLRFGILGKSKGATKKFIIAAVIEIIPWVGALSPSWLIFVISTLKNAD